MTRLLIAALAVLLLASCDSSSDTQSGTFDNNQKQNQSDGNTAPARRDPTPQTGTGGESPVQTPTGTEQR